MCSVRVSLGPPRDLPSALAGWTPQVLPGWSVRVRNFQGIQAGPWSEWSGPVVRSLLDLLDIAGMDSPWTRHGGPSRACARVIHFVLRASWKGQEHRRPACGAPGNSGGSLIVGSFDHRPDMARLAARLAASI